MKTHFASCTCTRFSRLSSLLAGVWLGAGVSGALEVASGTVVVLGDPFDRTSLLIRSIRFLDFPNPARAKVTSEETFGVLSVGAGRRKILNDVLLTGHGC